MEGAAAPIGPDNPPVPVGVSAAEESDSLTHSTLVDLLKAASCDFERAMGKAMKTMLDTLKKVEDSLVFEGRRVDDLEAKNKVLETRLTTLEKRYHQLEIKVNNQENEANKSERYSRRNNVRFVGLEELSEDGDEQEDCVEKVVELVKAKFEMDVKVERAHRDGKRGDKPRHILVKFTSYQEKVDVMRKARAALAGDDCYIVDDLTRADLTEKRKHMKKVQELFKEGTKLRFYAGAWRINGGAPFDFK